MNFIKNKLLTIVLVLCLVFTIFVGITANHKGNFGIVQGIITGAVTPVQKVFYTAGQRIGNVFYFVSSIANTRKENIELKGKINDYQSKLVEYDTIKRENEELTSMLNFKNTNPTYKLLGATIVGKVGENWFDVFVIDVGEKNGVKKGQYVVNGEGLVGQVIETDAYTSKVQTILDDKANIPCKISSTGETGLAQGTGNMNDLRVCKVNFLPPDSKVKQGDIVVTSNIITDENSLVQDNLVIGTVTSVEDEKPNLVKVAYFKPAVNFKRIEKVMVVIK